MKAVVVNSFGPPEVLEYQEVPEPRAAPGQVLIRVAATGVNFADVMARRGRYHGGAAPPFVPGLDVAGTITAGCGGGGGGLGGAPRGGVPPGGVLSRPGRRRSVVGWVA